LGKFEAKGDEGYFIGYSMSSKAFRVFNKRTMPLSKVLAPIGTKDAANQEVKKNKSSLRYIVLPNWAHDALLESTSSKLYEESSTQVPKGSGNPNPTASVFNPPAEQMETLTVESLIPTVSSPVPTACLNDSSEPSSEARLNLRRSLMLCKTQAGWKLCKKSFFNSKSKKSELWLIVLKGLDPLGQNGFSRTRRMKEELLSEIRPG
nr:retrovirus-related Pol polyprotein from transposon TNT 1-94 [Tanacetum cinerariifolium]